ncbi:hypothetical protein WG906_07960 [Pedobacter sp. P351]|uniref:hypothetical protein n=1 Tax=Pedobacter superstes TaxID=3133441 RepID=UPI00309B9B81
MKYIHTFLILLFFFSISKAQVVDYNFINSIVSKEDSGAIRLLLQSGYSLSKDGDYRFIADNKIKAYISHVKANPEAGQKQSYWAFQARGKKAYSPILKQIKKGATVKSGSHFGKQKTEYKSPEGIYYYPFEDSMFDGLYWIYASKESLLD